MDSNIPNNPIEKARVLAYLKKEEEYLKELKRFVENELFRLQIEELNLSAALRSQRVKTEKDKLADTEDPCTDQKAVLPLPSTQDDVNLSGNAEFPTLPVLEPLDLGMNHANALKQEDLWG